MKQKIKKFLEPLEQLLTKIRKKMYYNVNMYASKRLYDKIKRVHQLSDIHDSIYIAMIRIYVAEQKQLMQKGEKLKLRQKGTIITNYSITEFYLKRELKRKVSKFIFSAAINTLVKTGVIEVMAVQHKKNNVVTEKLIRYKMNTLVSTLSINLKNK